MAEAVTRCPCGSMTVATATYSPGWVYTNAWPARPGPVKSTVPSPSKSASTVEDAGAPSREKVAVSAATPLCGLATSANEKSGADVTVIDISWLAVAPSAVVATAFREVVSGDTPTKAAKAAPCTAAGTPLTVTPTSAPPAFTVPRTRSGPAGTLAPFAGDVMAICRLPTVNARDTGSLSLPARSRALTSKVCEPAARLVNVVLVDVLNAVNAWPSSRHANSRLEAGVR